MTEQPLYCTVERMPQSERIECRITGRVQMVMYRDFAQRKARNLGLFGFARNNNDGSVSVVAEGPPKALKEFVALLHKGSVLARVENVEVAWKEGIGEFENFSIAY